jgi:hypothetical protein
MTAWRSRVGAALAAIGMAIAPALADESSAARDCARVAVDAARLACYDALFRADPQAAAKPPAAADSFGLERRRVPAPAPAQDKPKRISAKVVAASELRGDRYRVELDNGQVWETQEASWSVSFAPGQDVVIDRGVFNAYRIAPAGQGRFIGAKRIK